MCWFGFCAKILAMRAKPLILIADDDEDLRKIITVKVQSGGWDVMAVADGEEAVQKAKELKPDLILMDINMPKMLGTEAALAIKSDPQIAGTKIAFLSNLEDPWPAFTGSREEVAKELGMETFIDKAKDLDKLEIKIKELLNGSISEPPPQPPQSINK